MAFVGRATVFWIQITFFLLFVVLKLDGTTNWLWHFVFIPIWILDIVTIVYLASFLIAHYRTGRTPYEINDVQLTKYRKIWLLTVYLFKVIFTILLCLKLDGFINISYMFVCLPLWIMLVMLTGDAYVATWKISVKYHES